MPDEGARMNVIPIMLQSLALLSQLMPHTPWSYGERNEKGMSNKCRQGQNENQ
jgi:hypothetical protein